MKTRLLVSLALFCTHALGVVDQNSAITIYNNGQALVRSIRQLDFSGGVQHFKYIDVSARIDPTSVHLKSLSDPGSLLLLEQHFEYDLVDTNQLLEKYLGKNVTITMREGGTDQGILLSSANGDVIIQSDSGRVRALKGDAIESIIFPKLPGGLISRPTLAWILNVKKPGSHKTELSYLTSGINWHAEYIAVVDKDNATLDLSGWVSIHNNSGAVYQDAKLKLVAGDTHRVQANLPARRTVSYAVDANAEKMNRFKEKGFFEYHLYTLQRPVTIQNRQVKQVSLFEPFPARVDKTFIFDGARNGKKVKVALEFDNKKLKGSSRSLPKGKVRVYKKDDDGSQEFIGEDAIDHTPEDQTVHLNVGNAFDIIGERIVKSTNRINKRSTQKTVEITLQNHKKENLKVKVVEHFQGDWRFIGLTPVVKKKTAQIVEFEVAVPANTKTTFQYTVVSQR